MDDDDRNGEFRRQCKNTKLFRLNLSGCSVSKDMEYIMLKIPALLDVDVGRQKLSHVFGLYTEVWNGIVSCTRGLRFHWSVKRICLSGNGLSVSRCASICTGLFSSKNGARLWGTCNYLEQLELCGNGWTIKSVSDDFYYQRLLDVSVPFYLLLVSILY